MNLETFAPYEALLRIDKSERWEIFADSNRANSPAQYEGKNKRQLIRTVKVLDEGVWHIHLPERRMYLTIEKYGMSPTMFRRIIKKVIDQEPETIVATMLKEFRRKDNLLEDEAAMEMVIQAMSNAAMETISIFGIIDEEEAL